MTARREHPIRLVPRSVTDSLDGQNSEGGAMASLANLIFDPSTPGVLQCRPANLLVSSFAGFTTPGAVSAAFEANGIVYGMVASGSPAGKDTPFAYNISTATFETVSGISSANCPTTQSTSGDWTPPSMAQVGARIIVTHPGFNFAGGYAFGYFDLSGYTNTFAADISNGSKTVNGSFPIAAVGPGYPITGAGIPANTVVTNTSSVSFNTTGTLNSTVTITGIPSTANMYVGQLITGSGIPLAATIASIVSGTSITISSAATATASGVTLYITGNTLTLSQAASATTNGVSLTVAGGTAGAPVWCAGNTTGVTQLAQLPSVISQYYNRAYFAAGQYVLFTDILSLNVSNVNGVQVLTVDDASPINALEGLPFYTTTGGILQALVVFKQYSIWQITGDAALNSLALNQLSGSVGTQSPRSVVATPTGIFFRASDGIRSINLQGAVSEPDKDMAVPFIYAQYPTRIAACFNSGIYSICVQNSNTLSNAYQNYYYYTEYEGWTGPHGFRIDCVVPYLGDFIVFNNALPATMWRAPTALNLLGGGTSFVENGTQLTWQYQTAPVNGETNMYASAAVRSTLDLALPSTGDTYQIQASDINSGVVGLASITTPNNQAIWGEFNWGAADWGATQYGIEAQIIPWSQPLIFQKLVFQASGNSSLGLKIGSLYIGYEQLGYLYV